MKLEQDGTLNQEYEAICQRIMKLNVGMNWVEFIDLLEVKLDSRPKKWELEQICIALETVETDQQLAKQVPRALALLKRYGDNFKC